MIKRQVFMALGLLITLLLSFVVTAQNEFAATLEVLKAGVEVQRVNTANFISVSVEAIVGVGDTIRTDETGSARVTFFADGTDVTLDPNTEYRIVEFQGDEEDFQLTVEVLVGQTTHRLNRVLGANSSYDVETPGMTLAAQGTVFEIRVEDSGRSGMLVSEGVVDAETDDGSADVPSEFGVRSAVNEPLSDVVRASTFEELDSALDGCSVSVTTVDDVSINVRVAPSLEQERIGIISASDIDTFYGVSETGQWYRIMFEDDFGWILSSSASVDSSCAGLRVFENASFEDINNTEDVPSAEATQEAED